MVGLTRQVFALFGLPPSVPAATLLVVSLLVLVYAVVRVVVGRVVESTATRFYWQRGTGTLLFVAGLLAVARLWVPDVSRVLTALGLVAAGLVVVLKDLILDAVASVVIVWRRLFLFGDRIRIGAHQGDVIDMSLFYFTLLEAEGAEGAEQSTGRVIRVPNAIVLTEAVTNATQALPFVWTEIAIVVALGSDVARAEAILLEAAARHAEPVDAPETRLAQKMRRANILYSRLTPVVYAHLQQDHSPGLRLTLRFLCRPRKRRDVESAVTRSVLDAIAAGQGVRLVGAEAAPPRPPDADFRGR